ncbi:MAG: sensor histidine kinase [Acidimicrobiia bacterium]
MGRRHLSSVRRWAVAGPLIAAALVGALVAWARPETGETLGFLGMVIGFTTAGILMYRRSGGLERRERIAWRYLTAGLFLVATGVTVVGVLTLLEYEIPAFGPTDMFFLAGYAMLIVALYRLARSDGEGRDWVLTILDALVGAIALSALVWTAFYHELVDHLGNAPAWERVVGGIYPVLDVAAVIALMILVIRRSHFHWDPRLLFLAFGLAIQVGADLTFLASGIGRAFAEAEPSYALNLLAIAGFLATAAVVDRAPKRREFPERDAPLLALMWPYLLVVALLATHVIRYHSVNTSNDGVLLLDALIIIGAVVFLRQMLMIHRNRIRVETQRSELVASVSHELRTPLTAMVGYLSLLDESGDEFPDEARREMLSEATGQARHMARLVSDLVMLARGNHRHVPLEITETTVSNLITSGLRGIEPGNTRIAERFDGDASVRVDADRLRQALTNLLSNAMRYGGDQVVVTGRVIGRDLLMEVHDNGPGVPTRYETAIWERFERGAHRLNAVTPGLGIGLAIVQAIAEAHGGRAEYRRSELLGGACFSLGIPGCVIGKEVEALKI